MKKLTISLALMVVFLSIGSVAMAYTIVDDATGGDCTQIGVWDAATKTCTLTADLSEGLTLASSYLTLDGNNHAIIGTLGTGGFYGLTGLTVKNSDITGTIWLKYVTNPNVVNNNVSSWIYLWYWAGGTVTDNFAGGISVISSRSGVIERNTISGEYIGFYCSYVGMSPYYSSSIGNIFSNNTVSGNYFGVSISEGCTETKIYKNNFINHQVPVTVEWGGNIFNLDMPVGGNYWSNYDTPEEGCNDMNYDGICDVPSYFYGGADNFPWAKQNGWLTPEVLIGNIITSVLQLLDPGETATTGTVESLSATLENALTAAANENIQASENMLKAFINQVEAQAGRQITEEAAAQLIQAAQAIINKP